MRRRPPPRPRGVASPGRNGVCRPGACEKAVVEEGEGATHRCTVFYEGLEVAWKVRFSGVDASGGWTTASYRA